MIRSLSPQGSTAPPRRDRGMTLPEVLITLTIAGIVMGVLSAAMITFLRNAPQVSERVDRTRGVQQLVNYLPADVASAQTISTTADGCPGEGAAVLDLTWSEVFGDERIDEHVTYRRTGTADDPNGTRLVRVRCGTGGDVVTLASEFDDVGVVNDTVDRVIVTLRFGETSRTVAATSRNLAGGGGG